MNGEANCYIKRDDLKQNLKKFIKKMNSTSNNKYTVVQMVIKVSL